LEIDVPVTDYKKDGGGAPGGRFTRAVAPKRTAIGSLRVDPFEEVIPNQCGSGCGCGRGPYHACTDIATGDIIARFNTANYKGTTAVLHFETGIAPYPDQHVFYEVWIDGIKKFAEDYTGCAGPYERTVTFTVAKDVTEVRWRNVSSARYQWLIVGDKTECDPTTTQAWLEILTPPPLPEMGLSLVFRVAPIIFGLTIVAATEVSKHAGYRR
jgi:hypothetical protein